MIPFLTAVSYNYNNNQQQQKTETARTHGTMVKKDDKRQSINPQKPIKKGQVSISGKKATGKASTSTPKTSISSSSHLTIRLQAVWERCKTLEESLASTSQGKGKGKVFQKVE